ncbi:SWIM zinc finger protein [Podospora didyma]|uniref:SWIM zinc finger protein n=1 Tax=Podospora didyma TaxID=330526 RepID=A0AAE0K927_9PEZI|nr:SWIM zinc finger protein [Podospora didyma]
MGAHEEPTTPGSARKRKLAPGSVPSSSTGNGSPTTPNDMAYDVDALTDTPSKKAKKGDIAASTSGEKRLRRYRPQPPQSFAEVYGRATSQRFYVLSRTRCGTAECPEEMVELTGSTGNIYTVTIAQQPSCSCPHGAKGNQCKHVLYVLSRVLRAKYEYVYQLALVSSELVDIFANAPPPPDEGGEGEDKNRKPVDGDCPICFNEFETGRGTEVVVWCRAACGQNIHKECFEMWAATKRQQVGYGAKPDVTCPYCRSVWVGDDDSVKKIKKIGNPNEEGYVNVADQLGISTERDISTYSRFWSRHPDVYRRRGHPDYPPNNYSRRQYQGF